MPDKKKSGLLAKLKVKNRKNKLAKMGLKDSDLYSKDNVNDPKFEKAKNAIVFKNGGKTKKSKKAKRAGKKVIRKIKRGKDVQSQSSKDIMAKVVGRTTDPARGGSAGSGSIKKTTALQKVQGKTQSVLSTRAKKKVVSVNKAVKKGLGYSKGGFIQYD